MEDWLFADGNCALILVRIIILTVSTNFIVMAMNAIRGWSR